MPDRKIGISADVKQGAGFERLLKNFEDVEQTAEEIERRFKQLDTTAANLTKRGVGSASYTRELRQQLQVLQDMARLNESNARRAGNVDVQRQMSGLRGQMNTTVQDLGAVQTRLGARDYARLGAQAAVTALGYKSVSMFRQGYGSAYGMLPGLANFSQTMAPSIGQATNAWAYDMLGSAHGYGYANSDILGGAQTLQGAMGRSRLFNSYMRGIAQFGRYNGFDFNQASGYFASNYQEGSSLSPIQYATLVAQTVNAANMQGRNAQVVQSLQQMADTVTQTMTGLTSGAQTGLSSMYATVGRTGNQAFINQFPGIFNAMNSSIIGGTSLGPMGMAAQWQAIAPGMNYWQAQYLASQGAMGIGPNGKPNWENKLKYAYSQFGGNTAENWVQGGAFMGLTPTQMKQMVATFMPNGQFNEAAITTKAGKKLLGTIENGSMSPLDKTMNNFNQAANNEQKAASKLLSAASKLDQALGSAPYASAGLGLIAGGLAGRGMLGTILGRGGARAGGGILSRLGGMFGLGGDAAGMGAADLGAAGGLETAGIAADSSGIGLPVGIALGIAGLAVAGRGINMSKSRLDKIRAAHPVGSMRFGPGIVSSPTPDYTQKASDAVNTLAAMRPWANQINSWFGSNPVENARFGTTVTATTANAKAVAQIMSQFTQAGGSATTLYGAAAPVSSGYTGTSNQQFIKTMTPVALQAAAGMGVPSKYRSNVAKFLIAQWAKESGWGTSEAATLNDNFGGIEPPGSGHFAGKDSKYAGYTSLSDFANGVSYWYTKNSYYSKFLNAARKGANPAELATLIGQTPYAGGNAALGNPAYGSSIANQFLPIISNYYKTPTQTVKVQMPRSIKVHILGPNGQEIGNAIVPLTTRATMNGQHHATE